MFYEEKVVDGVLRYRNSPNGVWYAFTPDTLTGRILDLEHDVQRLNNRIAELEAIKNPSND